MSPTFGAHPRCTTPRKVPSHHAFESKASHKGGPSAATATNAEETLQGNEEGSVELELPEDEEALRQELAEQKRIAERGAGHCPRNQ